MRIWLTVSSEYSYASLSSLSLGIIQASLILLSLLRRLTTFTGEVDSFPENVDFRRKLLTFHLFLFTSYWKGWLLDVTIPWKTLRGCQAAGVVDCPPPDCAWKTPMKWAIFEVGSSENCGQMWLSVPSRRCENEWDSHFCVKDVAFFAVFACG